MPRIAYVNGRYLPHAHAQVHIEDRGYQFADGVYEVIHVRDGRLIDAEPHFERFDYSLGELHIAPPMPRAALRLVLGELLLRNAILNGLIYFQSTREPASWRRPNVSDPCRPASWRTASPWSAFPTSAGSAAI